MAGSPDAEERVSGRTAALPEREREPGEAEPPAALRAAHPLPQDRSEDEAGADTAGGRVPEDTGVCVCVLCECKGSH